MEDLTFRVKAHSENPTKTVVKARTFQMIIDEPTDLGGTNEGANPVEYVLAAFSGCLNVMCHVVAQEMNFALRGVEIKLSGKLNPEKLFGKETTDRAGYKEINVEINPDTDADQETLEKWVKTIEARCPVSDNLSNPTPVHISVKK
ncbi:MAG: OsmC family protein [Bacteroidia bacterium]|nr:OsmC family protein [Bacteroidia bacterium]